MKKTILFLIILLYAVADSNAQYNSIRNKVWAFGAKAGIDFNSGSPVPIVTGYTPPQLTEGCASVCDTEGHLLFYTNGTDVYNRNHVLMPTGTAISSYLTWSTTQGALILPVIGDPNKYYIFTLQQATVGDTAMCHLVYCKVDMALAGGYGDVVAASRGTAVADSLSEKMMAVTGNNKNIWLMVHKQDTALFEAYEITAAGVSTTPVISATGTLNGKWGYLVGTIKVSHNRRKIVSQSVDQTISLPQMKTGTELYDFDPATGKVSNCIVLDSVNSHYGAEFSPDNRKLYSTQKIASDTTKLWQYDISLATAAAMRASKTLVAIVPKIGGCDLKLAPDAKIYFLATDTFSTPPGFSRYMNCITNPNLAGAACGYVYRSLTMAAGTGAQLGLPNTFVSEDTIYATTPFVKVVDVPGRIRIMVYPNPASTVLYIAATEKITHISISNIAGQVVHSSTCNSELARVDIGMLPPNLYFVKVNEVAVQRFVKE